VSPLSLWSPAILAVNNLRGSSRPQCTAHNTPTRPLLQLVPGYTILVLDTNILLSSLPMVMLLVVNLLPLILFFDWFSVAVISVVSSNPHSQQSSRVITASTYSAQYPHSSTAAARARLHHSRIGHKYSSLLPPHGYVTRREPTLDRCRPPPRHHGAGRTRIERESTRRCSQRGRCVRGGPCAFFLLSPFAPIDTILCWMSTGSLLSWHNRASASISHRCGSTKSCSLSC